MTLALKTLFITGASRGIGLAIALRAARDGANIIVAAKTAAPHPRLPGTIYSAAEAVENAGGRALPVIVDVRDEGSVAAAMDQAVSRFGGIDILVNNASALSLTDTPTTDMKRYDLMQQVNTRGTYLCTRLALPLLKQAENPHVLNLSPPLDLDPRWHGPHVAYNIAKYGMSLCTLGHAEEFRSFGIAVNSLWPLTPIDTAAVRVHLASLIATSRSPDIMADAAHVILSRASRNETGRFFIDEEVLRAEGVSNFDKYADNPQALFPVSEFVSDLIIARSPTRLVRPEARIDRT